MSATTIRVNQGTRDRLNQLSEQQKHASLDATVNYLLDELWKARCIDQADQLRDDDIDAWRSDLKIATTMDYKLTPEAHAA